MLAPGEAIGSAKAPAPAGAEAAGWQARLDMAFERRDGRTVLADCRHSGPLIVQRPFYPEGGGVCHVYIVHPPGGVVAGDELTVRACVGTDAHALLTTPAAGKFYRSNGATAMVQQDLRVESGVLEWLPQENIFFPGASVALSTCVQLSAGARFFGWEISCLGLTARRQPFETGQVRQDLKIRLDAKWLLCEQQFLDREAVAAPWGMAGNAAVGTLVAYPAGEPELIQARRVGGPDVTVGATLVDGVLVCRAVALRTDRLREVFVAIWCAVRPLMPGRTAVQPRVWAT